MSVSPVLPNPLSSIKWNLLLLSCVSCCVRSYTLANLSIIHPSMMWVTALLLAYPTAYMLHAVFPRCASRLTLRMMNFFERHQACVLLVVFLEACFLLMLGVWRSVLTVMFSVIAMLFLNKTINIPREIILVCLASGGILACIRRLLSGEPATEEQGTEKQTASASFSTTTAVSALVLGATAATAIANSPSVRNALSEANQLMDAGTQQDMDDLFD